MSLRLVSYIENNQIIEKNKTMCEDALDLMSEECKEDRLGENYSKEALKLNTMEIYTIVFDELLNPVQASGCQIMSKNVVRVCSRYYVYKNFRTDGTHLLDKTDNFMDLKYCLPRLKKYPLIIWSRDKAPGFFKRLKSGIPDLFSDWDIYPERVEILWKNNFQNIFYVGDKKYVDEIRRVE